MRNLFLSGVVFCSLGISAPLQFSTDVQAAFCKNGAGLGVHRTVKLDTKGGVRYGSSHGRDRSFLKNKEVVLTFDDGPIPGKTAKVLHELDKHCAKATFFMVGTMARNNPSLARKVASKGHTVGIHSFSHKNLGSLSASAAVADVNKSIKTIQQAAGPRTTAFFRFPYLSENSAVNRHLASKNYGVFAIDVDSLDYKMKSTSSMVNRVMSELNRKGKGIILLHDIQSVTANGIGTLLTRLKNDGYKLVHIKGGGGLDINEPLIIAEADIDENRTSIRNDQISSSLATIAKPKRTRNAVRKRPKFASLEQKPSTKTKKSRATKKKSFVFSKAFRSSIKSRIADKPSASKTANKKPVRKKQVASLAQSKRLKSQSVFQKQLKKNQAAFRKALKRRLIAN